MTTAGNTLVQGHEFVEETYRKRTGWFLIFPLEWYEKVSTKHMGYDVFILSSKEIRQVYLNDKPLIDSSV